MLKVPSLSSKPLEDLPKKLKENLAMKLEKLSQTFPMMEPSWVPHHLAGKIQDVHYVRNFLEPKQVEEFERIIDRTCDWEKMQTRDTQEFGSSGTCPCGRSLLRAALPPWQSTMVDALGSLGAFHPVLFPANSVRLNAYKPGQGIHPHLDGPVYFPRAAIVSLGSHCIFDFYPRMGEPEEHGFSWDRDKEVPSSPQMPPGTKPQLSLLLEPGSLLVLSGDAFTYHRHGIKAVEEDEITAEVKNAKDIGGKADGKAPGMCLGTKVEVRFSLVDKREMDFSICWAWRDGNIMGFSAWNLLAVSPYPGRQRHLGVYIKMVEVLTPMAPPQMVPIDPTQEVFEVAFDSRMKVRLQHRPADSERAVVDIKSGSKGGHPVGHLRVSIVPASPHPAPPDSARKMVGSDTNEISDVCSSTCESEGPVRERLATGAERREVNKKFLAAALGNWLEWYDFGVYAAVPDILGAHFFPQSDPSVQIMHSFMAFAAGYLTRPVGGVLIGTLGDTVGRKCALWTSMLLMMCPTVFIGCLPTYAQIGGLSTALLVGLRLLQGIAVGGEYVSALVFSMEHARSGQKTVSGALMSISVALGTFSGFGVVSLLQWLLSEAQMQSFGWRICFWLGLVVGVVGLFLRSQVSEPEEYMEARQVGQLVQHPLWSLGQKHWDSVLLMVGTQAITPAAWYQNFIWILQLYEGKMSHQKPILGAAELNTAMQLAPSMLVLFIAFFRSNFDFSCSEVQRTLRLALCALPGYWLVSLRGFWSALGAQALFALGAGFVAWGNPFLMHSSFPVQVRVVAMGVSYNLAAAIFGGPTPYICSQLLVHWGALGFA
ncbi:Proline/betaine transporter (Proline porter II) (PPII) [Durusdinium trenchii]|uniref:Proline/betaine transporter (Proline porter II) (PPII) n=1 Tax=Durusdinium trenchii TaxID=1381693 RepID=A0ABP0L1S1_9DINO